MLFFSPLFPMFLSISEVPLVQFVLLNCFQSELNTQLCTSNLSSTNTSRTCQMGFTPLLAAFIKPVLAHAGRFYWSFTLWQEVT